MGTRDVNPTGNVPLLEKPFYKKLTTNDVNCILQGSAGPPGPPGPPVSGHVVLNFLYILFLLRYPRRISLFLKK